MKNISRRLSVALVVAGLALASHLTVHHQQRQQMRRDLLATRADYLELVKRQSQSLRDQFTPGFKGQHVFRPGLVFSQGEIFRTQTSSHLAVNGCGCFGVNDNGVTVYTRDGRFEFSNGRLTTRMGCPVLGYRIGEQQLGELKLALDPVTKLYGGKYTDFHFDETGRCFGDSLMTDPVTGQTSNQTSEPLFQVALFQLQKPEAAGPPAFLKAASAIPGRAGEGALGGICPASLELSNVDFASQGMIWQLETENGVRWWSVGLPASSLQSELVRRFEWDEKLRQLAMDNLRHAMQPGYRSVDVLGWMSGQGTLAIDQRQGGLIETKCAEDVTLDGEGYFLMEDGRWSRTLDLGKNQALGERWVGDCFATELSPVVVPADVSNVSVGGDGIVSWTPVKGDGKPVHGYRLRLGKAERVERAGSLVRPESKPEFGYAAAAGFGVVAQGYLELSNENGYQRRILGAALMEWAGLPLFPESPERRAQPPVPNPFPMGMSNLPPATMTHFTNPAMMLNPTATTGFFQLGLKPKPHCAK